MPYIQKDRLANLGKTMLDFVFLGFSLQPAFISASHTFDYMGWKPGNHSPHTPLSLGF